MIGSAARSGQTDAGAAERSKKWGRLGVGMNGGVGVFDKEYQSAPVNCKADRLSVFCASRAKMSSIRTRHDKTTLLVTQGDNGHFRTLRAITYKKILNKSNAILAACLHLLATFGLECRAFACKKKYHLQKSGGGGGALPPCPSPSAAYAMTKVVSLKAALKNKDRMSVETALETVTPEVQNAIPDGPIVVVAFFSCTK